MTSMPGPRNPYLESLAQDVAVVNERVTALQNLSQEQLAWKPDVTAWSVLECVEHLALTSRAYHPVLSDAISRAATAVQLAAFRPGLLARMFIKAVSPDPKLKVKTLKLTTPASSGLTKAVITDFLFLQAELLQILARAARVDINRVRIQSPLNRFLYLTVGEALTVLVRHSERHLQQMDRVRALEGFPAAA